MQWKGYFVPAIIKEKEMKTARERFQEGPHRAEWEKVATGYAFETAVDYALNVFIDKLTIHGVSHPEKVAPALEGVKMFIGILSTLHIVDKPPTPEPRPPELDYSVGKPKR